MSAYETQFLVRVFLLGFLPATVNEFCVPYCHRCKETGSYLGSGSQEGVCLKCKGDVFPVFQVTLLLKDEQSMTLDEVYKVHYYSRVVENR